MMYTKRIMNLRQRAAQSGLSAIALIPSANLYYFTGIHMGLSERSAIVIIPAHGPVKMVVPQLDESRVQSVVHVDEIISYKDEEGPASALSRAIDGLDLDHGDIGFEYRAMRVQELELLKAAAGELRYQDAGRLFASLRMIKDGTELEHMFKAASIAEMAMESALRHIQPGVTEFEVDMRIYDDLRKAGVTGQIHMSVASGERSGVPHNGTSNRAIQDGDLVWVDFMASYEGYFSDITRTFSVGQVSQELQEIYQVVLEAQQATRERARPGMAGREIDAIARGIIESRGFGKYFTHRTGHGLGLEVHEEPYIVASNDVPLEAGMTFTIEPGIYLTGKGGVRVEDDVVLVPGGCRSLTNFRRNLLTQKSKYVV